MNAVSRRLGVLVMSVLMVSSLSGCLAVGVGALAYDAGKLKEERTAFHAQNIEREKAGLKPLTWEEWRLQRTGKDDARSKPAGDPSQ
ncbi:MAG: hypothetical protein FJZ01_27905 [Candidatus Sericytochromatia bacterium]|nr:hypothetical protein [Candidatus Tanganyikabacteria bacterium]